MVDKRGFDDSTVVQFPTKAPPAAAGKDPGDDEVVWKCNCGSIAFHLHYDGTVECTGCKIIPTEIGCFLFKDAPTPETG